MNRKNTILLFLILVCLVSEIFVYRQWAKSPRTLKWDNAVHALAAVEIANDIRNLGLKSFLHDTNKQMFYPFIHSYVEGVFFILFGINDKSAVLCGFSLFFLSLILLYKICLLIDEQNGWLTGLLCGLLMLCVPLNLVYSTQVMLEMLCLTVSLCFIYFYLLSFDSENKVYSLAAGISLAALFFTKYNYGSIFILFVIFWETVNYRKLIFKKLRLMFLPVVLSSVIWFSFDTLHKIKNILSFALTRISGFETFSIKNILLYPTLIQRDYIPFRLLFWFLLAIFVLSVLNFSKYNLKLKFLFLSFIYLFATVTIHPLKDSRFLLPIFPLFVVTALAGILNKHVNKIFRAGLPLPVFAIITFIFISSVLTGNIKKVYSTMLPEMFSYYYGDEATHEIIEYSTDKMIETNMINMFIVGTFNELNNYTIIWNLYAKKSGIAKEVSLSEIPYPDSYNRAGLNPEFSGNYKFAFERWLKESSFNYVMTIELYDESSAYATEDYLKYCKWKQNYVNLFKRQNRYKLIDEKKFENKSITVRFYKIG